MRENKYSGEIWARQRCCGDVWGKKKKVRFHGHGIRVQIQRKRKTKIRERDERKMMINRKVEEDWRKKGGT